MKHFGDITKIHGWEVPIVDVVTGGSPCQDLSVAGKREGLAGERSGLFMEQIRVVKEMREHDAKTNEHLGVYVRPRYMVWENVTGALSSNGGEDFRAVLEETARIAEEGVSIPGLEKGEKWANAGAICGDGWSVAWRVHDAQFWGVPQRRKRICVLADFNGHSAAELLFERFRETDTDGCYEIIRNTGREPRSEVYVVGNGLQGDIEKGECEGEEVARSVGENTNSASQFRKIRCSSGFKPRNSASARSIGCENELSPTNETVARKTGTYQETTGTLTPGAHAGSYNGQDAYNDMLVTQMVCLEGNGYRPSIATDSDHVSCVCYGLDRASFNQGKNAKYDFSVQEEISQPLIARGPNAVFAEQIAENTSVAQVYDARGNGNGKVACTITGDHQSRITDYTAIILGKSETKKEPILLESNQNHATVQTDGVSTALPASMGMGGGYIPMITEIEPKMVVRRLTPMECERLQGFPDRWTDIGDWVDSKGKSHKDSVSPRYKALGNSIALPFWRELAKSICGMYVEPVEMASLFDGIGGFPLVFRECGGIPVWASEIEEFPMAVTKIRFPEGE